MSDLLPPIAVTSVSIW